MYIDEDDIKILKENFDDEMIEKLDISKAVRIYKYLEECGVYYAKDLFLLAFDLFLLLCEDFIKKFKVLKSRLG